jgi:cytochrome d ubiquinol oxidase subunit II
MQALIFLQNVWYLLIGVLLMGYSILDGFDLGVGTLVPFLTKKDEDRKVLYNAMGPFWDGNEVWLITGGGALFAAFPQAYATVFSGFYLALILVLFALIFRAVALEFWSYDEKRRKLWAGAHIIGSFLPALLFGVALGNVIQGIPLNGNMEFTGSFFTLLRPFPLIVGLLGLVTILLQGSTYTAMRTEGSLQEKARKTISRLWAVFILLFVLSFIFALVFISGVAGNIPAYAFGIFVILVWIMLKQASNKGKDGRAFLMSSLIFSGLWGIAGAVHYPNLVRCSNDPALSLTISNASSSQLTLTVMFIIALVGMPVVIGYTIYVYRVFKGKVIA